MSEIIDRRDGFVVRTSWRRTPDHVCSTPINWFHRRFGAGSVWECSQCGQRWMYGWWTGWYSHDIVFRLDTGRTNDNYEHQFVLPVQEAIDNAEVQRLSRVLWQAIPKLTLQELRRLVAALDVNT